MPTVYENLPAGTCLRNGLGVVIRVTEPMRGDWAHVEQIRKDGGRDRRTIGWSGSLETRLWQLTTTKSQPGDDNRTGGNASE